MPVTTKGLEGVVANSTRLSDVIGDKGQLTYAGYDIDELAGKVSFKEVVYLLWKGKLPNRKEAETFLRQLRAERELPGGVIDFIKSAPKTAGPMDVMRTAISMLGLYDPEMDKEATREINERRARSITAKIGVIAAYFHRARNGKSLPPVRDDLTEAEHFLYLINGEPQPQEASDTLDVAFVLHADHGMNASTFSARVTISTLTDFYSAITSAPCKARSTAARMRASSTCWKKSGAWRRSTPTSMRNWRKRKRSWASATAFTRRSTRARRTCSGWQ